MNEFVTFIIATLRQMGHSYPEPLQPGSRLVNDLGLDSLDLLEVIVAIEDHFSVTVNVDRLATNEITIGMLHDCSLEGI